MPDDDEFGEYAEDPDRIMCPTTASWENATACTVVFTRMTELSPSTKRGTAHSLVIVKTVLSVLLLSTLLSQQPTAATGLPLSTESTSWLARIRRDESEGIENRHRTASVGFYIGDPCNQTCSSVLYHVFCNLTSRRCECRPEYPVNVNNRQCVKASSLGGHCDHNEACAYWVVHSSCQENECRCTDGHEPDSRATKCTPSRGVAILESTELTTIVSIVVSLMLFTALFCLVLRICRKARSRASDRNRTAERTAQRDAEMRVSEEGSQGKTGEPSAAKECPGSGGSSGSSVEYTASRVAS
ncbi:uncharacterized protein LOC119394208 [Rhipicephalus sanguineus]|uniref:uncharacterized protein LOC119394208 n=1 Tax=Rhipicephalus sanguineus TaxID=34632 RepID=UPI00189442CE|nr:uncharacterized protein LOC119394208 [Rhipicephalus sanguineus]